MPLTIHSFIIVIFGILPGLLANYIFEYFSDKNRQESETERIFKIILFSVLGVIVYIQIFVRLNCPVPTYLFPLTFKNDTFTAQELLMLSSSFIGHIICSIAIGGIWGYLIREKRNSNIPNSWKIFLCEYLQNRYIVVALTNGKKYAGYVSKGDPAPDANERDIILCEPAEYDEEEGNYIALNYQYIFLPGRMIDSTAIVYNPEIDTRLSIPGQYVFSVDGQKEK